MPGRLASWFRCGSTISTVTWSVVDQTFVNEHFTPLLLENGCGGRNPKDCGLII